MTYTQSIKSTHALVIALPCYGTLEIVVVLLLLYTLLTSILSYIVWSIVNTCHTWVLYR